MFTGVAMVTTVFENSQYEFLKTVVTMATPVNILRGQGGVPWVQIMENEFECLVFRRVDGGQFAEKFVKKYCS